MPDGPAQIDEYSYLNRPAVFRKFARKAAEKSHAVLKSCWMILFTGGTFALLHSFDEWVQSVEDMFKSVDPIGSQSFLELHGIELFKAPLSFVLFVVYLLTFYRFYVGNIRVFDMIYDEVFEFIDSLHDEKNFQPNDENNSQPKRPAPESKDDEYGKLLEYSDNLIKWESFFLIMTALIVVFLTVTPLNPLKFLIVYFILLFFDILWLTADKLWVKYVAIHQFDVREARNFFRSKFKKVFGKPGQACDKMFPSHALKTWEDNNIWFATVIFIILGTYCAIYYCYEPPPTNVPPLLRKEAVELMVLWLGAAAALANCCIDLRKAWTFYHPTFSDAYKELLKSQTTSSGSAA
ncbi:MAG TPA: hypothetical protein VNZ48_00435 [Xanthobacteraceae bacterium]|nr:hypothetical protein [Xanthobacteraceae bacterium]